MSDKPRMEAHLQDMCVAGHAYRALAPFAADLCSNMYHNHSENLPTKNVSLFCHPGRLNTSRDASPRTNDCLHLARKSFLDIL